MENNNYISDNSSFSEKILAFDKDISFNNNCNYNKFDTINEIYYNEYSSLFTKNNETNKYDNLNLTSDIKSLGNILTKKSSIKDTQHNNIVYKDLIDENEKPSISNLIRKAKKILFTSLLKYDNYIISKVYNNKLGNGINIKKLFKINHFQIKNVKKKFNKELLNTPQGVIFSSDISKKFSSYPYDHNKQLIKKLLNEKDEKKSKIFNNLFNRTLLECINHLLGIKKLESLEGLNKFFDDEIIELEDQYKELLKKVIKDLGSIFTIKKKENKKIK
jgi:hypothetical protein